MKQLVLLITLLISAVGFSKTGENEICNLNALNGIELIKSKLNVEEFNTPIFENKIVDIRLDDDFPCTLSATVTTKVIVDGEVIAEVTMAGSLQLDNCFDMVGIGASFVRGLVNDAIAALQQQMNG